MYQAKSPLLGQSGVFVRYIIKKQPESQEEPPEPSLEPSWGVLERFFFDFGHFLKMSRTKSPLLGKSGHFVRDILKKHQLKMTAEAYNSLGFF